MELLIVLLALALDFFVHVFCVLFDLLFPCGLWGYDYFQLESGFRLSPFGLS